MMTCIFRASCGLLCAGVFCFVFGANQAKSQGQINGSDGLRAPGSWNDWQNGEGISAPFAFELLENLPEPGLRFWRTRIEAPGVSEPVAFKIVSGPPELPAQHQWACADLLINAKQPLSYCNFSNNYFEPTPGRTCTILFEDRGYQGTEVTLSETDGEPAGIVEARRLTAAGSQPAPNQFITIQAELDRALGATEKLFCVWTTDDWASRHVFKIERFKSPFTGSGEIPGQAQGAAVAFYFMTSVFDLESMQLATAHPLHFALDFSEVRSYSVADGWETTTSPAFWSDADSWTVGEVPSSSDQVIINGDIIIDGDVSANTVEVNPGGSLTFNHSNATLNISPGGGVLVNEGVDLVLDSGKVLFHGGGFLVGDMVLSTLETSGAMTFSEGVVVQDSLIWGPGSVTLGGVPVALGPESTLQYPEGAAHEWIDLEWNAPHHVEVQAGNDIKVQPGQTQLALSGNLDIDGDASLLLAAGIDTAFFGGDLSIQGALLRTEPTPIVFELGGDFTMDDLEGLDGRACELLFTGSMDQTLNAPSTWGIDRLTVDKTTGGQWTLAASELHILPGGILSPKAGLLNLDNNVIRLRSDSTGTAGVGPVNAIIEGDFVGERFVPAKENAGVSFVNLGGFLEGNFVGAWTLAGAANIVEYDETVVGDLNDGWQFAPGPSGPVGRGYMAQFPAEGGWIVSEPGPLWAGPISIPVTYTPSGNPDNDGWNLVSNPYPAPVAFENIGWTALNGVDPAPTGFFIFEGDNEDYTNFTGAADTLGIGQSFWVKVSGSGSLDFEEQDKSFGDDFFVRQAAPSQGPDLVALRLTAPSGHWSRLIVVRSIPSSGEGDGWDLPTFGDPVGAGGVRVWSQHPQKGPLSVVTVDSLSAVGMHARSPESGWHAFSIDPSYPLPENACLMLADVETGDLRPLVIEDALLSVPVWIAPDVTAAERFSLHCEAVPIPTVATGGIGGRLVWPSGDEVPSGWDLQWQSSDMEGQAGAGQTPLPLNPGTYNFQMQRVLPNIAESTCAVQFSFTVPDICLGDFNGDFARTTADLLSMLTGLGTDDFAHDLDGSGETAVPDFLLFLSLFDVYCSPE